MNYYNLISYFNEAFGVDAAEGINLNQALAEFDDEEHLAPECSEYFDCRTFDHVDACRPLMLS
jgi:hypothetical protein